MSAALILSSYVVAGRMGGGGQLLALAALGMEPYLAPSVVLGRSPARGGRGRLVAADHFSDLLADMEDEGLFASCSLVITGHFSDPGQVHAAASALRAIRAQSPRALLLVDPILGDHPKGLYVKPEVSEAVVKELVPLADWLTPNLWELEHITGSSLSTSAQVLSAARRLAPRVLVTSCPAPPGETGLLLSEPERAVRLLHPKRPAAPNGVGDLVAAVFGAGLAGGQDSLASAMAAAEAVCAVVDAAAAGGLVELPIVAALPRAAASEGLVVAEHLSDHP